MSLLDRLDSRLVVASQAGPAQGPSVTALKAQHSSVPAEYLELIAVATEIEFEAAGNYLRVWGPEGVLEMDEAYGISSEIPGAIPIGDDGGGSALVYMEGLKGEGVYFVRYGDLERDEASWVAPSLEALLCKGEGLDVIDLDLR